MNTTHYYTCITFLFFLLQPLQAQDKEGITHSGKSTGQPPFPVRDYQELSNPTPVNKKSWIAGSNAVVSWGSTLRRYKKEVPVLPEDIQAQINLLAWKGERVSAQLVVSAFEDPLTLSFEVSDLVSTSDSVQRIPKSRIFTGFVRYVMTDELNRDGKGACGHRNPADFDSTLVADPIDHLTPEVKVPVRTTRAGWVRVWVSREIPSGTYKGTVLVRNEEEVLKELELEIMVGERVLPAPSNWKFHLDLWQNPFAVARYYQVEPWSREHFDYLRKDMQNYADAGGKVITASIMHKPWNGQTHDYFETMVRWIKKADGTWEFDYSVFDKWVNFMMNMGIDKQINCYSMVPWRLSFQYFDQATNTLKFIETQPGEEAYEEIWTEMLTSFANHLREKGWFDRTYISMDERPMETMKKTIKVIRQADKDFKISFAGGMHPELLDDIDDYCRTLEDSFPEGVKQERQENGKISTFYTSCSQARPNSFTFSPPAESQWYGWYAAKEKLDGYLRWAYNSWVLEPLLDSRFTTWAAGDTYFVYPGGRTSIRFEQLVQGIQVYEKIHVLKAEFEEANDFKSLAALENALELFSFKELKERPASEAVKEASAVLNSL